MLVSQQGYCVPQFIESAPSLFEGILKFIAVVVLRNRAPLGFQILQTVVRTYVPYIMLQSMIDISCLASIGSR